MKKVVLVVLTGLIAACSSNVNEFDLDSIEYGVIDRQSLTPDLISQINNHSGRIMDESNASLITIWNADETTVQAVSIEAEDGYVFYPVVDNEVLNREFRGEVVESG